jgi:predicted GNAT family N-acyltransferase
VLEEQVFDARRHDRAGFHCGVPALDDYLHKYAAQQNAKGISTVFVFVDDAAPSKILGFYTLSAAQIDVQQLHPVPCFRMGRLARAIESRGAGMGEILIGCAVDRCLHARSLVGAYALLVDAKDDKAKSFYERYGFIPCLDAPMTLYLPLG